MNVNFSIDLDRVGSSVQAAIRPAVEKALAGDNMEKRILKMLTAAPELSPYESMVYRDHKPESLIDSLVRQGVAEIAQQYVRAAIKNQQPKIETALKAMMADSNSQLVQAFADAAIDALGEEWEFAFSASVSPKEKSRD